MGGILAVFGTPQDPSLPERLEAMLEVSPHRGAATRVFAPGAALAAQVVDREASIARASNAIVSLHGYVWNWCDLGEGSENSPGEEQTDAERLAVVFSRLGPSSLGRLRGQYSFIVWDVSTARGYVSRDVSGSRPLFLSSTSDLTVIGTAPRQVAKGALVGSDLDAGNLVSQILGKAASDGSSVFRGISTVAPEKLLEVRPRERPSLSATTKWTAPEQDPGVVGRSEDLGRELSQILRQALSRSLPKGEFALALSGGHDSGLIWGCLNSLSVGDEGPAAVRARPITLLLPGFRCDESSRVKKLLSLYDRSASLVDVSSAPVVGTAVAIDSLLDCPGFPNLCVWEMVAREMARSGIRTLMTGDGGDAFFTGRSDVLPDVVRNGGLLAYASALLRAPGLRPRGRILQPVSSLARALLPVGARRAWRGSRRPSWLSQSSWQMWCESHGRPGENDNRPGSLRRRMLLEELRYLQFGPLWQYWDQMGGAMGIEVRFPYADQDIIEFAFRVPSEVMGTWGYHRGLVSAAARWVMPRAAVAGFRKVDYDELLERAASDVVRNWDSRAWQLVDREILDREGVQRLVDTVGGRPETAIRLVTLFFFEVFARRFSG